MKVKIEKPDVIEEIRELPFMVTFNSRVCVVTEYDEDGDYSGYYLDTFKRFDSYKEEVSYFKGSVTLSND